MMEQARISALYRERDEARSEAERLLEAVNAYLLAQNHAGWKDGNEACKAARRELCGVVYGLNGKESQ